MYELQLYYKDLTVRTFQEIDYFQDAIEKMYLEMQNDYSINKGVILDSATRTIVCISTFTFPNCY